MTDRVPPVPERLPRRLRLILSVGGIGLAPVAPGTFGSLPPVLLALTLGSVLGAHWTVTASVALLGLAGAIACVRFAGLAKSVDGECDHCWIVVDEIAGQSVALLMLPWVAIADDGFGRNLMLACGAFIAFRFFDIVKPPPIRRLERIRGGLGVLLDDLAAGAMALALVHLTLWVTLWLTGM